MERGRKALEEFARGSGWRSAEHMASELGVPLSELEGLWFPMDEEDVPLSYLLSPESKRDVCKLAVVGRVLYTPTCKCFVRDKVAYALLEEFSRVV